MATRPSAPSFARDIEPLFRMHDRAAMSRFFDLGDYQDVRAHAQHILARLSSGKRGGTCRLTPSVPSTGVMEAAARPAAGVVAAPVCWGRGETRRSCRGVPVADAAGEGAGRGADDGEGALAARQVTMTAPPAVTGAS